MGHSVQYRPLPQIFTVATPCFSSLTSTEYSAWLLLFSADLKVDSNVPIGTRYIYAVLSCFEAMKLKSQKNINNHHLTKKNSNQQSKCKVKLCCKSKSFYEVVAS